MSMDILKIRKALGRDAWFPPKPYGPGWHMTSRSLAWKVTVSTSEHDGVEYIHAAMIGFDDRPSHEQVQELWRAVFGTDGYAYQTFPPTADDIRVVHLHGRSDGQPAIPQTPEEIHALKLA